MRCKPIEVRAEGPKLAQPGVQLFITLLIGYPGSLGWTVAGQLIAERCKRSKSLGKVSHPQETELDLAIGVFGLYGRSIYNSFNLRWAVKWRMRSHAPAAFWPM